jgi:broad specificity phosphatase PhoE
MVPGAMPAVILVRHAQGSYGGADYDVLSPIGADQATALDRLELGTPRLVSGSLRRQRDTALPWTSAGAELHVDARWDEYTAEDVLAAHSETGASLENPEGLTSRQFQELLDGGLLRWIAAAEQSAAAETWPAFRDRIGAALADLVAALDSGQTGVVFTSAGVIAACCVVALGLPEESLIAFNHVGINAGLTKLVAGRRGTTLVSFNEHAHLDPRLVTYR